MLFSWDKSFSKHWFTCVVSLFEVFNIKHLFSIFIHDGHIDFNTISLQEFPTGSVKSLKRHYSMLCIVRVKSRVSLHHSLSPWCWWIKRLESIILILIHVWHLIRECFVCLLIVASTPLPQVCYQNHNCKNQSETTCTILFKLLEHPRTSKSTLVKRMIYSCTHI